MPLPRHKGILSIFGHKSGKSDTQRTGSGPTGGGNAVNSETGSGPTGGKKGCGNTDLVRWHEKSMTVLAMFKEKWQDNAQRKMDRVYSPK